MKVELNNFLVAKAINIEQNVNNMMIFHIFMEDSAGVAHQVAFASRINYAEGVMKSFRRLSVVKRPEQHEERVRLESRRDQAETEGEGDHASGEGIFVDQADSAPTGDESRPDGSVDALGTGVPAQPA